MKLTVEPPKENEVEITGYDLDSCTRCDPGKPCYLLYVDGKV